MLPPLKIVFGICIVPLVFLLVPHPLPRLSLGYVCIFFVLVLCSLWVSTFCSVSTRGDRTGPLVTTNGPVTGPFGSPGTAFVR